MMGKNRFTTQKAFLIIASLLVLSTQAPLAQEKKEIELEEIVVTATRIEQAIGNVPGFVSVITEEEIKTSTARTIDDLLRKETGMDVVRPYGLSSKTQSVTLRGIYGDRSSRTLILLDGVPLNDLYSGAVDWNTIPLEAVERIEILRGANSAIYGSNALGGVINIITRKPEKKFRIGIDAGYGNMNTWNFGTNLTGSLNQLGYLFSGGYTHTDGYKSILPEERKPGFTYTKREMDKENLLAKFSFETSPHRFDIKLNHYHNDANYGMKNYEGETDSNRASLHYSYKGEKMDWLSHFYFDDMKDSYTSTIKGDIIEYENRGDKNLFGLSVQNNFRLSKWWHIVSGIEFRQGSIESTDDYSTEIRKRKAEGSQRFVSPFFQNEFPLLDRLSIYLGGRYDLWKSFDGLSFDTKYLSKARRYEDRTDGNFNPKFGVVYRLTEDLPIRGSIGRAFRAPSLYDLYRTWHWGTYTYASNPDLGPEKLWSYEIGIDKEIMGKGLFRLTFYQNDARDFIYSVSTAPKYYEKKNVAEVETRGIEMEAQYKLANFWKGFFNYTYNYSNIGKCPEKPTLEGKRLMHSPAHKGSLGITFDKPKLFKSSLSGRYVGKRYDDDENKEKLGDYIVFDFGISRKFPYGFELSADIRNFTNRKYRDSYGTITPGIEALFSIKKEF